MNKKTQSQISPKTMALALHLQSNNEIRSRQPTISLSALLYSILLIQWHTFLVCFSAEAFVPSWHHKTLNPRKQPCLSPIIRHEYHASATDTVEPRRENLTITPEDVYESSITRRKYEQKMKELHDKDKRGEKISRK